MALTAKQMAQVAKAPAGQKAGLKAMYQRQNANAPKKNRNKPPQRYARSGALVPAPKGLLYAFDGFDKRHLPLDELTAPYTTTNFVTVMEFGSSPSMDQVIVVCPRTTNSQEFYTGPLSDFIAVQYDAAEVVSGSIPVLNTARCPLIDEPARTSEWQHFSVRARLHNMSVRVTCTGTNTGLYPPGSIYVGTVPMIETDDTSTGHAEQLTIKRAWAEDSISVGYIKPVSAVALQERPLTLHASIAENVSYKSWRDVIVPPTGHNEGSLPFSTALEPIVIYVPRAGAGTTVVNYRLEIGQQWCTRHPHNIMLRSTQKQHRATPPNMWHSAVAAVKNIGEHLAARAGEVALDALANRARAALSLAPLEVD